MSFSVRGTISPTLALQAKVVADRRPVPESPKPALGKIPTDSVAIFLSPG